MLALRYTAHTTVGRGSKFRALSAYEHRHRPTYFLNYNIILIISTAIVIVVITPASAPCAGPEPRNIATEGVGMTQSAKP